MTSVECHARLLFYKSLRRVTFLAQIAVAMLGYAKDVCKFVVLVAPALVLFCGAVVYIVVAVATTVVLVVEVACLLKMPMVRQAIAAALPV